MNTPSYSLACQRDVMKLLKRGGSLTAYRANPKIGVGPREGSWAWRLEREIEKRFKVNYAVVTNSGTSALHAGLRSLNLNGGEVITSPLGFSASAAAILLAGGTPVFCDVNRRTFTITADTVKKAVTKKTKAILFVHLFKGQLEACRQVAQLGLPVVEDACQAVGFHWNGIFSGGLAFGGAYSFGANKQVPAGEGGCFVTGNWWTAQQVRLAINHSENFGIRAVSYNYRLNEVSACIAYHGLLKLKDNTPYLTPYLVKKRGPNDKPYLSKHLGHYPAFAKYMRGPLPVADRLCKVSLCVR